MSELRIIPVVFGGKHFIITDHRMQYDYGQVLDFKDLELPDSFEARFSNSPVGESVGQIGTNNRIRIPKQFFESGEPIYCYITLHDEVTDGRTVYTTKVPIKPSSERTEEEPEPEEESIITQAISALNTAVEKTAQDVASADALVQAASEQADRAEHAAEGVESYAERAEEAQSASESARDLALESKVSAQASAATATEKASEASESAATASQSAMSAESASESAQEYASASAESALRASQFAVDASVRAHNASEYAQTASTKASEASQSASTASQKALEASQSAANAQTYAINAESAKTASEAAQGLAESARDGAVSAKTDAESARDEAQEIADSISGKVEQIDSNTERIESLEDDRYKPYPTDIVSGSIASFPDGADDIPLKSCIVQVEPVQDLHGYDSPWPAGGGKNKVNFPNLSIEAGVDKQLNIGTVILPAGTYTFSYTLSATVTATRNRPMYLLNGVSYFGNDIKTAGRGSWTFTLEEQSTLAFKWWGHTVSAVCTISDFQLELGSTATDYAPYENICPISGFTGCEVQRTGKNLFDKDNVNVLNAYIANDKVTTNPNHSSVYIPCKPNTTYTVQKICVGSGDQDRFSIGYTVETPSNGAACYGIIYSTGASRVQGQMVSLSITTGQDAKYLICWISYSTGYADSIATFQLEAGSTATAYEPYQGNTYPITFPSEAGTIYGAYVDVINGELVVDRAMTTNPVWTLRDSSAVHPWIRMELKTLFPPAGEERKKAREMIICSKAHTAANAGSNVPEDAYDYGIWSYGSSIVRIYIPNGCTEADAQAYMEDIQIVYPLPEPIHYPLTPTQINSMLGQNNLWADTGDTEVIYRADTKLYISRLTEPDADMVADANIVSGQYFMVGNNLYRATANIASGASVIVGTNATKVSLAQALNAINQ